MPVETRAQLRAREEASKGPSAAVGHRTTAKKVSPAPPEIPTTTTTSNTSRTKRTPPAKRAPAKRKPSTWTASTAKNRKAQGEEGQGPLDTIVVDLKVYLPSVGGEEKKSRRRGLGREEKVGDSSSWEKAGKEGEEQEEEIPKGVDEKPPKPGPALLVTESFATEVDLLDSNDDSFGSDIPNPPSISISAITPITPSRTTGWMDAYPHLPCYERAEKISGYVCYRTDYTYNESDWTRYKEIILEKFRAQEAEQGKQISGANIVWVEDEEGFASGELDMVRRAFNRWCHERNPALDLGGEDSVMDCFPKGPYQDFSSNICLVADSLSIASVLNPSIGATPNVLILDRTFDKNLHKEDIRNAPPETVIPRDPMSVYDPNKYPEGFDSRELVKDVLNEGEKVMWEGYEGWFRAAIDQWMHVEPEAQGAVSWWIEYFAVNAKRTDDGCWRLLEGGVLE